VATSLPTEIIVGSCACQVLGPATAATLSYRHSKRDFRVPFMLLGGIVVGTVWGSTLLDHLKTASESDPTTVKQAVQSSYLLLLWGLGSFSLWESIQARRGKRIPIGWARLSFLKPTCEIFGRNRRQRISIASLSWFGLAVGFLSGFLGLSGGVVLLPGLHYAYRIPSKRAVKMSMLIVFLIAIQATIIHARAERVDLSIVMILLVGGTIGAKLGARLSERMSGGKLRKHFAWLVLGTALLLTLFQF